MRPVLISLGLLSTALGFIGIPLPGLPSTPFFILAAFFFTRSSPRLRRWVEELPSVGPVVRNYYAGAGLSKRVKRSAICTMALMISLSCFFGGLSPLLIGVVIVAGAFGAWFIWFKVPM